MLIPLSLILGGTLPTVVMIHGAGGGGWEYQYWKPKFEQAGYRVEAPDLMPAKAGLAQTELRDCVAQTVRVCGTRPVILVGASMGGVIVLAAAPKVKARAVMLVSRLGVGWAYSAPS